MAILYGVATWMILSIADIIFGILDYPVGAMRVVFYALLDSKERPGDRSPGQWICLLLSDRLVS